MGRYNNIRPPQLADVISRENPVPLAKKSCVAQKPVLRFLSFNCPFNRERNCVYDYESLYEIGSSYTTPPIRTLKASIRYYSSYESCSPGDDYFWSRLKNASDGEIYFLDTHFDYKNLNRIVWICEHFSKQAGREATQVIIITGCGSTFKRLEEEYNSKRALFTSWKNVSLTIYSAKEHDFLHDRFVLFDGVIWHFGASAGGMHPGLNAYSGPWEDSEDSMKNLLQIVVSENGGHVLRMT